MKTAVKAIVSVALLLWLLHRVGLSELASTIAQTNWVLVGCVCVVQTALVPIQTLRWLIIARRLGADFRFLPAWRNVYIGQFFNQVFPSSVGGDAVRLWYLRHSIPVDVAIGSVALERIIALFAVTTIVVLGAHVLLGIVSAGPLRWGLVLLVAGVAIGLVALLSLDKVPLPSLINRLAAVKFARRIPAMARQVFFSWSCLGAALLLSVIIQIGIGTSLWLLALGLDVHASLVDFLVLAPLITLVTALPISVGGWGVRESATVTALSLIGVPAPAAFAISVEFGLVMILVGLPGGLFWLLDADNRRTLRMSS